MCTKQTTYKQTQTHSILQRMLHQFGKKKLQKGSMKLRVLLLSIYVSIPGLQTRNSIHVPLS